MNHEPEPPYYFRMLAQFVAWGHIVIGVCVLAIVIYQGLLSSPTDEPMPAFPLLGGCWMSACCILLGLWVILKRPVPGWMVLGFFASFFMFGLALGFN